MSELKEHLFVPYSELQEGDELTDAITTAKSYYLKSEADKVIEEKDKEIADLIEKNKRLANKDIIMSSEAIKDVYKELHHQKYKRCLNKAEWCEERCARYDVLQERHNLDWGREIEFYYRWYKRWLKLADKFKELKNAED